MIRGVLILAGIWGGLCALGLIALFIAAWQDRRADRAFDAEWDDLVRRAVRTPEEAEWERRLSRWTKAVREEDQS